MSTAALESGQHNGRGVAWPPAKTIYALRACIALATAAPGARMKTGEIAQMAAVPKGFLSKILGELRAADIVSAQRGYYGGYRLTRPPGEIHIDELLAAVGTRDPFSALSCAADAPLPFIDDLRSRLHALAVEALHSASLAELASSDVGTLENLT
jgi:Rrf2 family protein